MKKFKFRLERVAITKEKQVRQKTNELSNLIKKLELERSKMSMLKTDFDKTQQEIFKRSSKGCTIKELQEFQQYIDNLSHEIQDKKKQIV